MKQHAVPILLSKKLFKPGPYLFPAVVLLYLFSQPAITDNRKTGVSQTIESLLASGSHPLLQEADFSQQGKELIRLYSINAQQMIWLGEGRSEKNRNDALEILGNAASDGLNPLNYDTENLRVYFRKAAEETDIQSLASYDLALSISMLRFLHDLHMGRIDPHSFKYPAEFGSKPATDFATVLKRHIDQQNITELPQELAPKIKQYQQLKQALAFYRQQTGSTPRSKLQFAKSLRPGESDPQISELRQRLRDLGELTPEQIAVTGDAENVYDEVTVAAVIHLQQQQGLHADGVIGKQTQALLNLTPAEKIALIELAMERIRWLPETPEGPLIIVNIPAFQLWAFNSLNDQNVLNMKVIVGKSEKNQTPVLLEEMKYLEFMPYWNIPKSIMDNEILPKLQTNNDFLNTQDIELVDRSADDDPEDADNIIDDIKHGRLRARQLPGGKNPLGRVKFIFPNKADVYLHDTPSHGAFNRDRRDLSHGCVRVAEAEKLAEFVLGKQEGWDKLAIQKAMQGPKTKRVSLKKSIPVLFFYSTAFADQDNKLHFYPDIYGYDQQLQNILNKSANKLLISNNATIGG